jgi:hypothetical protein
LRLQTRVAHSFAFLANEWGLRQARFEDSTSGKGLARWRDTTARDSLPCDIMDRVRPQVDAYLLDWITRQPFCLETENTDRGCRKPSLSVPRVAIFSNS